MFVPGNSLSLWPRHMQWAKSSAERDDRGESWHYRHRRGVQGPAGTAAAGGQAGASQLPSLSQDVRNLDSCDNSISDSPPGKTFPPKGVLSKGMGLGVSQELARNQNISN